MELQCLAQQNNGFYIKANSEELVEALERTLDCPMVAQTPVPSANRVNR